MSTWDPNNSDRAGWAEEALDVFAQQTFMRPVAALDGDDLHCAVKDLVTNLCHFMRLEPCLAYNRDQIEGVLTSALNMHNDEEDEDDDHA